MQQLQCRPQQPASHASRILRPARYRRALTCVWTRHKEASQQPVNEAFFGRKRELEKLSELCSGVPASISVILGPRNSGKTRLLQHFAESTTSSSSGSRSSSEAPSAPSSSRSHINARIVCVQSPQDMARALQERSMPAIVQQLDILGPFMKEGAAIASGAAAFVSSMQERLQASGGNLGSSAVTAALETFLDQSEVDLISVLAAYHKVLDEFHADRMRREREAAAKPGASAVVPDRPVLILDEANVLMSWSKDHPAELAALLRFFISVTKEGNRSHILLATSDSSFPSWLAREIGPAYFQSFVVGDFPKDEARQFLDMQLLRQQRNISSDADWEMVFEVCGGNAGGLCNAACAFRVQGEWMPALQQVAKDTAGTLWWGMFPPPAAGYSASDFGSAVKMLLASPDRAVKQADLVHAVPGGLAAVESMVEAGLFMLRPFSDWASDIPRSVFGEGERRTVVMAPSPLHYYVMKEEEHQLLAPLWGAPTSQGQATDGGGTSTHTKTFTAQDLALVRENIAKVEEALVSAHVELQATKRDQNEGVAEHVASLRRSMEQMREEKTLLREMELVVMKNMCTP